MKRLSVSCGMARPSRVRTGSSRSFQSTTCSATSLYSGCRWCPWAFQAEVTVWTSTSPATRPEPSSRNSARTKSGPPSTFHQPGLTTSMRRPSSVLRPSVGKWPPNQMQRTISSRTLRLGWP